MRLVIKPRYASSRSVGTALLTTLAVVITVFSAASTAYPQEMSHEEEVVRNAYAKLSFLCGLPPVKQAAETQIEGGQVDPQALATAITDATPIFTLSDFQIGPITNIASETWDNFVTYPPAGGLLLKGHITGESDDDNRYRTEYQMATVYWSKNHETIPNPEAVKLMLSQPVSEIIKLGGPQWAHGSKVPITYTRYAAFTVDAAFQGQMSGPHKAIFFFGTDPRGNEFVAANDLITGENPLWPILNGHVNLSGLLLGKVRETPVVANWLRANVMNAASCSATPHEVCCAHGRCGISPVVFNRDLSTPIPAPKD